MIATTMPRCLHINESGFQCIDETLDPTEFCASHQKVVDFEPLTDKTIQKMVFRFIAFILLLLFLIPFFNTLKSLYVGPPAKAQEAW
jgi:hypothetical protein